MRWAASESTKPSLQQNPGSPLLSFSFLATLSRILCKLPGIGDETAYADSDSTDSTQFMSIAGLSVDGILTPTYGLCSVTSPRHILANPGRALS